MKHTVLSCLLLLTSTLLLAQEWTNNYHLTSASQYFSDIEFPLPDKGFAVGTANLFMRTNDGGVTWETVSATGGFSDIQFVTPTVGYVCGATGKMMKTIDGGETWFNLNPGTTDNITELHFINPLLGYALMYNSSNYVVTVKKTVNGGLTWTIPGNIATNNTMRDIYFINENVGFVCGMGGSKIYRTTNGGINWSLQTFAGSGVMCIDFIDNNKGFAAGHNGKMWKTTDMGISWTPVTVPSTSLFINLQFTSPQNGWASGYDGTIVRTRDGGETWELQTSGTTNQITNMYLMNSGYGWYTTFNNWQGSDIFKFGNSPLDTYDNIIRGHVFVDSNTDCVQNPNDRPHSGVVIKVSPGPHYAITDTAGNYSVQVPAGNYSVSQLTNSDLTTLFNSSCPAFFSVSVPGEGLDTSGFDFGNDVENCPFVITSISSNRRRRCMLNQTVITCYNAGNTEAESPEVTVTFPEYVIPVSADYPYTMNADSTYSFLIPDLLPMGIFEIHITDSVACLPELLGRTQCTMATVTPKNACTEASVVYDGSDIEADAECLVNSFVRLSLYNFGEAMTDSAEYRIYLNSELLSASQYMLGEDDTLATVVYSNGQTYRIEADQRPEHPTKLQTNATVEACTKDSAGVFIFGYLPQLPQDDEDPETSIHCLPIRDSYDPNEKTVSPEGIDINHYLNGNNELRYHVCFQNTGNDTAYNIYVIDTLSSFLDFSTLHMGFATHDYTLSFPQSELPVLRFDFNDIYLPDSTTNEPESNGCFDFFIRPVEGLTPGTVIENFVDIYFDFNDPIRTNTAFTTILDTAIVYDGPQPDFPELPVMIISDSLVCAGDPVTFTYIDVVSPVWTEGLNGPVVATGEQFSFNAASDIIYVAHAAGQLSEYDITVLRQEADFNADGEVSTPDLLMLLTEFGCSAGCATDINGDGFTGTRDVIEFLAAAGTVCSTGE